MVKRCFQIIGAGLGAVEHLTIEAREAICAADAVLATERIADGLHMLRADIQACDMKDMVKRAASISSPLAAILVSGDVGFFSAAKYLREQLLSYGRVELLCGQSSLQFFCARLGLPYDDVALISLHGRSGSILGPVSYHHKTFALTGGIQTVRTICKELSDAGFGSLRVHAGENLGTPDEYIASGTAHELAEKSYGDLAVLLVENEHPADCFRPVFDCDLMRAKVPMTKEEVRWVSVAKLGVRPADVVYDIGAGTGSVSLELARKAHRGMVYAVERNPEAVALLAQNCVRLGGHNIQITPADAPQGLESLPAPDAVFIGGSGGKLREILKVVFHKNPAVRVVINVITLETLHEATETFHELGKAQPEIIQMLVTRGCPVGNYTMMKAGNPVFILCGGAKNEG